MVSTLRGRVAWCRAGKQNTWRFRAVILMRHELVTNADAFAAKAHEGQMRKLTRGCEEPYIEHPRRVARRVAGLTGSPRLVAAALLHDVIEDCGVRREELRDLYGDDVAEWVW